MSEVTITQYMRSEFVKQRFAEVVGEYNSGAYLTSVLLAVANDPTGMLSKCAPESIYISALRAASLRLSVDAATGQAYLVPFKNRATLIVGYKGFYDMAIRTGRYRYINVGPIYNGEIVVEDRITGYHRLEGGKISSLVIGWIGAFEMVTGYAKTVYMTVEEIHRYARKYSKGYDNPKSAWRTDPQAMEKKTVLRILLRKWGYLDPGDLAVVEQVEQENEEIIDVPTREIVGAPELLPGESAPSAPDFANENETSRPYPPAVVRQKLLERSPNYAGKKPSEKQTGLVAMLIEKAFAGRADAKERRHDVQMYLFGRVSLNDAPAGLVLAALNDWLKPIQDSGGDYNPDPMAEKEINRILTEALVAEGQQQLFEDVE